VQAIFFGAATISRIALSTMALGVLTPSIRHFYSYEESILSAIVVNVFMPIVVMPRVYYLSVFMLNLDILGVFMLIIVILSVFILSVFIRSVDLLIDVILSVVSLSVIKLCATMLNCLSCCLSLC
jgi:hypothetical protein